mmetsp:Transcript_2716/g.3936  ORF Transcript_2716/g.3936 Transcript_2716/m.3936 type:complete len:85 (-) Transcript_2716:313-567(-)
MPRGPKPPIKPVDPGDSDVMSKLPPVEDKVARQSLSVCDPKEEYKPCGFACQISMVVSFKSGLQHPEDSQLRIRPFRKSLGGGL